MLYHFHMLYILVFLCVFQPFKNGTIISSSPVVQKRLVEPDLICSHGLPVFALCRTDLTFSRGWLVCVSVPFVGQSSSVSMKCLLSPPSIIPGTEDKVEDNSNIVPLSRNFFKKASIFNLSTLSCLLHDMMLFKYRYVIAVLRVEGVTIHTDIDCLVKITAQF